LLKTAGATPTPGASAA